MAHSSSFTITNPRDLLCGIVIPEYDDFVANNASVRHALLAIITAYHMYEWVNRETFKVSVFEVKYPSYVGLAESFELARNITNGTKHFVSKAKTRAQAGFSSGFSDEFARPLIVEFPNGRELPVEIFLREIVNFWREREAAGDF